MYAEDPADFFGTSVDISEDGESVVIGAPLNNGAGVDAGQMRVFDFLNNQWQQRGFDIDGDAADDRFGSSLAISGDGSTVAGSGPQK